MQKKFPAEKIIGCESKVHGTMGLGFPESVDEKCLLIDSCHHPADPVIRPDSLYFKE